MRMTEPSASSRRFLAKKAETTAKLQSELAAKRPSKYRSIKVTVNGRTFHSKKEAARYGELILLEKAGEISQLTCQPRYPMVVNGHKVCTYVGDFAYLSREGLPVTEDVKSAYTAKLSEFRTKAKLFRALYGREIQLIGA